MKLTPGLPRYHRWGHKTLASHNDKAEYRGLCPKHIEIRSARYTIPSEFDRKAKFCWICTFPQNYFFEPSLRWVLNWESFSTCPILMQNAAEKKKNWGLHLPWNLYMTRVLHMYCRKFSIVEVEWPGIWIYTLARGVQCPALGDCEEKAAPRSLVASLLCPLVKVQVRHTLKLDLFLAILLFSYKCATLRYTFSFLSFSPLRPASNAVCAQMSGRVGADINFD